MVLQGVDLLLNPLVAAGGEGCVQGCGREGVPAVFEGGCSSAFWNLVTVQ